MDIKPRSPSCIATALLSLAFIAGLLWQSSVAAATTTTSILESYNLRYLTMEDGLRHNFIDNICRDSRGFIWIGLGGGGLARYDGYEFISFSTTSERHQMKGNFAVEMAEDTHGRMWVATDGGLDVFSIHSLGHVEISDKTGHYAEMTDSPVWAVTVDSEGKLWVRSASDIYCVKFDSGGCIEKFASMRLPNPADEYTVIRDLEVSGTPWSCVSNEVCKLNPDFDKGIIKTVTVADCLRFEPGMVVTDLLMKDGEVWIASDLGLWRYNPAERITKNYINDPANPRSLSQNYITSLSITPDKRLIAGTLRGVNLYNPISDNFERIVQAPLSEPHNGLNSNFINTILVDGNRIWVGTEGGGINLFTPKRLMVTSITRNFNSNGQAVNAPVNAILTDEDGTVWAGTVEGGLHHGDPTLSTFTHYTAENGYLSHNSVSAIAREPAGRLWVGTWGGGVNVLSTKGKVVTESRFIATTDGLRHIGFIGALVWDHVNKLMWIGASRGLYVYSPVTDEVTEAYPNTHDDIFGAIGATIDRNDHLWIGTSKGLVDIDLRRYSTAKEKQQAVRHVNGRFNDPSAVADERITFLFLDREGKLWVGTNGNGMYCRETDGDGNEWFTAISSNDGLPNDNIHGITQDHEGNLWVSTYKGIARINHDRKITTYSIPDGLSCDRFYWNAAACTRDGKVLFGAADGLTVIHKRLPRVNPHEDMKINFTHVWADNDEISIGEGRDDAGFCPVNGVVVHERYRSLLCAVSALDYDGDNSGTYYYRLKGFDPDWLTVADGSNYIRYTNLSPGHYTLQVKYSVIGEDDNMALMTELPLTVVPYFYRRWWFILLVALSTLLLGALIYRYRISLLKKQQLQLKKIVAERTAEIEEQKRQVQQLTMDRISFFTNITHEFRTPITLILGPVERALKLSYNPQVIEQLHFVERNSKYLLSLVNQLMDFRKVESGKMEIMRSRSNLLKFLENITGSFIPLTDDRHISLRLITRLPAPIMSFDEVALQKVLINLLGNAVKFTPENGSITVMATLLPAGCVSADAHSIYLSVNDSGNGIAPDEIDRIFDRFYQGTSPIKYPVAGTAGSGIGLYLCRSLVEIYGGTISVKNNKNGHGCCFRVILPLPAGEEPERDSTSLPVINNTGCDTADMAVSQQGVPPAERSSILVVEDNDDMRAFIQGILTDNFNVSVARNGEEALKILADRNIDLIISDLMMPVMDGLELSRRVKENFDISHIPILMLTAKTGREPQLESYRTGVDGYILKPFDEELLIARINNILESRRRYQQRFASGPMEVESLNIDNESRDKKFMDQVMKVIHENYRNSYFEIGDFAEALGVSRSLLNKKLQSLVGQPAGQLLRTFRLNTARELLVRNRKTRAMNISEIAYEVGFNDSKYFTRCFTKQFNITPSAILNEGE